MKAWVHGLLGIGALVAIAGPARAVSQDDLLDPAQAFRLSAAALDAHRVEIRFRIAKGYYMYRDRFRFQTEDGRVIVPLELPRGEMKSDPFFGRTEVYHDEVHVTLPLPGVDLARQQVRLKVVSQGCAEVGVCYVPQEQWVSVRYAPGASVEPSSGASGLEFLLHGNDRAAPSPSSHIKAQP